MCYHHCHHHHHLGLKMFVEMSFAGETRKIFGCLRRNGRNLIISFRFSGLQALGADVKAGDIDMLCFCHVVVMFLSCCCHVVGLI